MQTDAPFLEKFRHWDFKIGWLLSAQPDVIPSQSVPELSTNMDFMNAGKQANPGYNVYICKPGMENICPQQTLAVSFAQSR